MLDIGIVKALSTFPDPFVCNLYGVLSNVSHTFVVTSCASGGDPFTWCNQNPSRLAAPGPVRENHMKLLMSQLFCAKKRLHELGVTHRDTSLETVLLTTDSSGILNMQLIDFGMCSLIRMSKDGVREKDQYQAPEMHTTVPYDAFLSDAFALSVVLFATLVAECPWESTISVSCDTFDIISDFGLRACLMERTLRCVDQLPPPLIMIMTPDLVDYPSGLLAIDANKRLTVGESDYGCRKSVWDMHWFMAYKDPMVFIDNTKIDA